MKYAICNEVYEDWPFEKACAHARNLGYRGVEIAPFTIHKDARQISDEQRRSIVQKAKDHELDIIGLHWLLAFTEGLHLTTNDESTRRKTADYLCELTQLCHDLGGTVMVFGSPAQRNLQNDVSKQQADENAIEVFRQVVPTLEELNITLALEPLGPEEGNYLLTADETTELMQQIDSPHVRLHLDVKAMSTEATPIPQIIEQHNDHMVHFHANDPNRLGPGMGDVDYIPIFRALQSCNYDRWVSVEVFDYSPGVDVLVGDSIRYMSGVESELNRD